MTTYYNAEFAAEYIVKRDPDGNWCEWNGAGYDNLLKGQGTVQGLNGAVYCMAEGPDGKIYVGGSFTNAGGVGAADYIARWNPVTEQWEAVGAPAFGAATGAPSVNALAFDAAGNLYAGGYFINAQSVPAADYIAKFDGTNWSALGTGTNGAVYSIAIAPNGDVYAGGNFTLAGGVANTAKIAKWDGTAWSALSTGLNDIVRALAFAPNGDLFIGGSFTDAAYPRLCKYYAEGNAFLPVGTNTDIGAAVYILTFGATGYLYAGGAFTNAGGNPNADYIAKWSGSAWESLGTGTNDYVRKIVVNSGKVYASGGFTAAGGLTLTDRVAVYSNGAWQPLDIDLPGTTHALAILPASDGSLYIGGEFSTAAETPDENAVCGLSYEVEVAEEIEDAVDEDDIDPIDNTGV